MFSTYFDLLSTAPTSRGEGGSPLSQRNKKRYDKQTKLHAKHNTAKEQFKSIGHKTSKGKPPWYGGGRVVVERREIGEPS